MSDAEQGRVPDATIHAFVGELAAQEKATIRFGVRETVVSQARKKRKGLI